MKYDLIVIGGGPGGYSAAVSAAREGLAVCLFEAGELGGTCLNVGCIPTKYLLDRAAALEKQRTMTADGILRGAGEYSFRAVQRGKDAAVQKLTSGITGLLRSVGVVTINGCAELLPELTVICNGEKHTADNIIIATGSETVKLGFPGAEYCIDSTAALSLSSVPPRLCVIGGGVIGLELGSAYLSYGSEVDVVEMLPRIIPGELAEASSMLEKRLGERGMRIHCGESVTSVEKTADGFTVHTSIRDINADCVLVSAGRKPRLDGINTSKLGILTGRGGAVTVDSHMRTNIPHIYAVGDVTGGYMLAHAAYTEADAAVCAILGRDEPVSYRVMPRCIYTTPPFAAVGMTPETAAGYGISTVTGRADYRGNGMAVAEGESGYVFAVMDRNRLTTLGFAIVGAGAPELIAAASMSVDKKYTADDWHRLVVAHPTLSETLREAVLNAVRNI